MRRHGLAGTEVLDSAGTHVGRIATTWPLDGSGEPELALVRVGRHLPRLRYLPLDTARFEGEKVHVPYLRWQIEDAPSAEDNRYAEPAHVAKAYWMTAVDD
jgi:hypothetical protein